PRATNGWGCKEPPSPRADTPSRGAKPVVGQMTEEAAAAKQLFGQERWTGALEKLTRVAEGATGDDEGNRQLAQYDMAIALFRLKRYVESAKVFRAIATHPDHLKHRETLLWVAKLVTLPGSFAVFVPSDLQTYTIDDVRTFHSAQQSEV